MNVILTGAAGWIGSHVALALVDRGHTVFAIIRPGTNRRRIERFQKRLCVRVGDFDEISGVQADLVIHTAWHVDPKDYLTSRENVTCLDRSRKLLALTEECGARAVFLGTCFEYDTQIGLLSEKSPVRPDSLYAACKDLMRFAMRGHPNAAWVRLFYQFGPWERPERFIPSAIKAILSRTPFQVTKGHHRRDYLHVEDVASAIVRIAESEITGCVNVGSGNAPSIREMIRCLEQAAGGGRVIQVSDVPANGEPAIIQADNELLRSTGWTPKYTLDAALRNALEWWRDSGIRPV